MKQAIIIISLIIAATLAVAALKMSDTTSTAIQTIIKQQEQEQKQKENQNREREQEQERRRSYDEVMEEKIELDFILGKYMQAQDILNKQLASNPVDKDAKIAAYYAKLKQFGDQGLRDAKIKWLMHHLTDKTSKNAEGPLSINQKNMDELEKELYVSPYYKEVVQEAPCFFKYSKISIAKAIEQAYVATSNTKQAARWQKISAMYEEEGMKTQYQQDIYKKDVYPVDIARETVYSCK